MSEPKPQLTVGSVCEREGNSSINQSINVSSTSFCSCRGTGTRPDIIQWIASRVLYNGSNRGGTGGPSMGRLPLRVTEPVCAGAGWLLRLGDRSGRGGSRWTGQRPVGRLVRYYAGSYKPREWKRGAMARSCEDETIGSRLRLTRFEFSPLLPRLECRGLRDRKVRFVNGWYRRNIDGCGAVGGIIAPPSDSVDYTGQRA